jgi:quinol-cytochrome oxidoreductase complex cytochrome b subunit
LRSIPNKLAGVRAVGLVFVTLRALPYIHKPTIRGPYFRPAHRAVVVFLMRDLFLLSWLGRMPVERPYVLLGQLATRAFFLSIATLCIVAWRENYIGEINAKAILFIFFLH